MQLHIRFLALKNSPSHKIVTTCQWLKNRGCFKRWLIGEIIETFCHCFQVLKVSLIDELLLLQSILCEGLSFQVFPHLLPVTTMDKIVNFLGLLVTVYPWKLKNNINAEPTCYLFGMNPKYIKPLFKKWISLSYSGKLSQAEWPFHYFLAHNFSPKNIWACVGNSSYLPCFTFTTSDATAPGEWSWFKTWPEEERVKQLLFIILLASW